MGIKNLPVLFAIGLHTASPTHAVESFGGLREMHAFHGREKMPKKKETVNKNITLYCFVFFCACFPESCLDLFCTTNV